MTGAILLMAAIGEDIVDTSHHHDIDQVDEDIEPDNAFKSVQFRLGEFLEIQFLRFEVAFMFTDLRKLAPRQVVRVVGNCVQRRETALVV